MWSECKGKLQLFFSLEKRACGSKSLYSNMQCDYDYLIVGSGFGGSVSAYRLTQKGYRVVVVEKGKRWRPEQFPESNWQLRKWLWWPLLRFRGIVKLTIMRHVGILSGVGVGGGSLMYANTLPRPREAFFPIGQLGRHLQLEIRTGSPLCRG
jgi:cholesterol oxidase